MKDDKELNIYEALRIRAIYNALTQNELYFFKKITRWYSREFNMPLNEVREKIPYQVVLEEYFESSFDNMKYNEIYDYAINNGLDYFVDKRVSEDEEWAKALEEEVKQQEDKKEKESSKENEKIFDVEF